MAGQIFLAGVTVAAGTPAAAPAETDIPIPPGNVERVGITFPDGCCGLVGLQLWVRGGQAIPTNAGQFIIANGRTIEWPLQDYPQTGAWQAVAYNTDVFPHTLHLEFLVSAAGEAAAAAAPPAIAMPADAITAAAALPP